MGKGWKRFLIALSVGLNLAFVGLWAIHAMPGCRSRGDREEVWCPLHRQLGATPEQWREIEPAMLAFQARAREFCGEAGRLRLELIELLAAETPDKEEIAKKQAEIHERQRRMQELVVEHLLQTRETLTPEQRKTLFDMLRRKAGCGGRGPMRFMGGLQPNAPEAGSREGTSR